MSIPPWVVWGIENKGWGSVRGSVVGGRGGKSIMDIFTSSHFVVSGCKWGSRLPPVKKEESVVLLDTWNRSSRNWTTGDFNGQLYHSAILILLHVDSMQNTILSPALSGRGRYDCGYDSPGSRVLTGPLPHWIIGYKSYDVNSTHHAGGERYCGCIQASSYLHLNSVVKAYKRHHGQNSAHVFPSE